MGEDYPRLRFLQHRTKLGTPATAVILQAGVALVMVLTATFEAILTYMGFALSICAGLTVIGVFHLRRKEPELARPYRTWGYPVTPALFVALSAWMVFHTIFQKPIIALAGLITILLGVGAYFLVGRHQPGAMASESRSRVS
jgi:APA family basic amino acid/polyamine antiporter